MLRCSFRRRLYGLIITAVLVVAALPIDIIAQSDTAWYWRRGDDPDTVRRTRPELDSAILIAGLLRNANLRGVYYPHADLSGADFAQADFSGANLDSSNLSGTSLDSANLSGARLVGANLSGASLDSANLSGVDLMYVDLNDVLFENIDSLPIIPSLAGGIGLNTLKYESDPSSLIALREEFGKLGFRDQERQIICALRRHGASILEWIFFDLTSEYGSNLARPWQIFIGIFVSCWAAYFIFMLENRKSGVRVILPIPFNSLESRLQNFAKRNDPSSMSTIIYRDNILIEEKLPDYREVPMLFRLIWWAIFFSGISAFNIGFRDVNFGRWLKLLTRTEFDLQPFGWVRVVSGFQALSSVYLVALWILSFSGTPFK